MAAVLHPGAVWFHTTQTPLFVFCVGVTERPREVLNTGDQLHRHPAASASHQTPVRALT